MFNVFDNLIALEYICYLNKYINLTVLPQTKRNNFNITCLQICYSNSNVCQNIYSVGKKTTKGDPWVRSLT